MTSSEAEETRTDAAPWSVLRKRAVQGSFWWVATYPISKVIQIGGSAILAAILSPAAFGIVAIGSIAVRAVIMFSEIGISAAIVQSPRRDERFLNTGWTMQVIRGVVVFGASLALARPMADWYGEPLLVWIVPAIGSCSIVAGLQSTKYALLHRTLQERPRAILELAQKLVTRVTMIAIALAWASPWCLVIGTFAGSAFFTLSTHLLPGTTNRLCWDRDAARALTRFGTWMLVGTLVAFCSRQVDTLMLGKLAADSAIGAFGVVGIYEIAQRTAQLPAEFIGLFGGQLAYPILAEAARREDKTFEHRVLQLRSALLPLGVTLCLGVVAVSPWFFGLLYDARYADATWMAQIVTASVWFGILNSTANRALLAKGHTRALAVSGLVGAVLMLAGGLVGFVVAQVPGFLAGISLGRLAEHLVDCAVLRRLGVSLYLQDRRHTLILLALASAVVVAQMQAGAAALTPKFIVLGVCLPLGVLAATAAVSLRSTVRRLRRT